MSLQVNNMSVTSQPGDREKAAYNARTALDEAQEYAELVANFAQMKYMAEGGEAEQKYLERLVENENLPFDEAYDPERIEGWVKDPAEQREILSRYEERIEAYLEDEAEQLRGTLKEAKTTKRRAKASGELEATEHRHYSETEIDPDTVAPEVSLADDLVDETDSYTSQVFEDEVKNRSTALARNTAFNGFSPEDM